MAGRDVTPHSPYGSARFKLIPLHKAALMAPPKKLKKSGGRWPIGKARGRANRKPEYARQKERRQVNGRSDRSAESATQRDKRRAEAAAKKEMREALAAAACAAAKKKEEEAAKKKNAAEKQAEKKKDKEATMKEDWSRWRRAAAKKMGGAAKKAIKKEEAEHYERLKADAQRRRRCRQAMRDGMGRKRRVTGRDGSDV